MRSSRGIGDCAEGSLQPREKLWNGNYLKVWSANFMIFFSFMLITPLFPSYLSDTFGADKQTIGIVLSGYSLTALLVRAMSGYMVDSLPRKLVLVASYFLFTLLFAGYLVASSLLFFAIIRTLHGAPFGAATVSNSTVAIDVLPSSRRAEGIGYFGLSNNIATAISPTVALLLFDAYGSYELLFWVSLLAAAIGLASSAAVKRYNNDVPRNRCAESENGASAKRRGCLSLDRFILTKGLSCGAAVVCYAFSYGVLVTYVAIYGKERLGISGGTGLFFMLLALGLILSRLAGNRSLREGKIVQNATLGTLVASLGYMLFASLENQWGYYGAALVIGLGNGHMFPAFQTMFINLAQNSQRGTANSTMLVSWDIGMGLGILIGGVVSQHAGYTAAFWTSFGVNLLGVCIFELYARRHFLKNRLR